MLALHLLLSCVCQSVCLSVTSRYCIAMTGRTEIVLACEKASFHLSHIVWNISNIVPNSGLKKVTTASPLCCQQTSSTVELVDNTYEYDERRIVAAHYTSVNCNMCACYLPHPFSAGPGGLANTVCCACPRRIRPNQAPKHP